MRVEFFTGDCEDMTRAREAKESPPLEAAARERLLKSQQTLKRLGGTVVICKVWRIATAL
jgi:hypothetical protein